MAFTNTNFGGGLGAYEMQQQLQMRSQFQYEMQEEQRRRVRDSMLYTNYPSMEKSKGPTVYRQEEDKDAEEVKSSITNTTKRLLSARRINNAT